MSSQLEPSLALSHGELWRASCIISWFHFEQKAGLEYPFVIASRLPIGSGGAGDECPPSGTMWAKAHPLEKETAMSHSS